MFETVKEIVLATFAGLLVGFLFAFIRLPIPAPPKLVGVMGIIGIFVGYKIYEWWLGA